ncbi:hypothetical protein [Burkholderia sp. BE17]|uniref:hypothetical protein n=1 Tax=Burkholderia sp. BE17 TaxID=2656644 RepID=UPI00187B2593|nr:hypothetical protein [Burkholderia sp. BE17]
MIGAAAKMIETDMRVVRALYRAGRNALPRIAVTSFVTHPGDGFSMQSAHVPRKTAAI